MRCPINLRDLQYLVALSQTRHFGRAALAVHVSQPTLSMQLKKLEDTLGAQLIERSNRQVMLTPLGEAIAARAERVLAEVAALKETARAARDPKAGTLRLGLFPTLAPYLLPRVMPALTREFPRLTLVLVEEKTPTLIAQLNAGQLDAALLAMPVELPHASHRTLFTEPFLLACARGHRLAGKKRVALGALARENVLLLEDGHCLRDQALAVCQRVGAGESGSFRATSLETLRHMVAASEAVTLMPQLATQENDPQLSYIPFTGKSPSRTIGLYWRNTSAKTSLFEAIAKNITLNYKK